MTPTIRRYLAGLGWHWNPTMRIGTGCRVHLSEDELPSGRLIVKLSRHLTCVADGVIYDTHDPQRHAITQDTNTPRIVRRCVYGFWRAHF